MLLYDTEFHTLRFALNGHADTGRQYRYVYSLARTPDGTRLVTVSGHRTVGIWWGRSTAASRRTIDDWKALRARMSAREDLAEAYGQLTGEERSAARVELRRRTRSSQP